MNDVMLRCLNQKINLEQPSEICFREKVKSNVFSYVFTYAYCLPASTFEGFYFTFRTFLAMKNDIARNVSRIRQVRMKSIMNVLI